MQVKRMEKETSNLEQRLNDNLITLYFRSQDSNVDKKLFNEINRCQRHIRSIHDIEKQLSYYGVYHCTFDRDPLSEIGYYYANNGSVLVANCSTREFNYFQITIPEIAKCDPENRKFICGCLRILKTIDQIDVFRVDGESLETFSNVDIDKDEEKIFSKKKN